MRAAVLTGLQTMEMADVPAPRIRNGKDVLIRMHTVGVCGSDIHYYVNGRIGGQVVRYPFTVGHEGAGVVEEVGPEVSRVRPGDRVAIDPAVSCFTCDQCLAGRPHTCRKLLFLGCPGQLSGCLCDYVVMPETSCYRIADTLSLTHAALSEPLSIGVYAVRQSVSMRGASVGVLGSGPIGLCVLASALAKGASAVYATDLLEPRLAVARRAGAAWAGTPERADAEVADREPLGLDVVFECCGQQEALDQAVRMLKPGGTLMLVGIPTSDRVSFPIDLLRRKEICIKNVRRQEGCVQRTLDMMANGTVNVDFLVTHRFPLPRAKDAFDLVAGYEDGVVKAVVDLIAAK